MRPARTPLRAATLAHADRLFPADLTTRMMARRLYEEVRSLPLIAANGRVEARTISENAALPDPARLFVTSDPTVLRVLSSHRVAFEELGLPRRDGGKTENDPREIWRRFSENYHLFRGTPTRLWLDHTFAALFGFSEPLSLKTADAYFDGISAHLARIDFRPRALLDKLRFEVIANAESPLDELRHYAACREAGIRTRVVPFYRADALTDPDAPGFLAHLDRLSELTSADARTWNGYLEAHKARRAYFKSMGATKVAVAPTISLPSELSSAEAEELFSSIVGQQFTAHEAALFRGHMLVEMIKMSLDDGLAVELHLGYSHHRNDRLSQIFPDEPGVTLASQGDLAREIAPLLARFGNEPKLSLIIVAGSEAIYADHLVHLAGYYPALRAAAGAFADAPSGLRRFRDVSRGTVGFYNSIAVSSEASFLTLAARHDAARRSDCGYLAELVTSHQLDEDDAYELAKELAYGLTKRAYKL